MYEYINKLIELLGLTYLFYNIQYLNPLKYYWQINYMIFLVNRRVHRVSLWLFKFTIGETGPKKGFDIVSPQKLHMISMIEFSLK